MNPEELTRQVRDRGSACHGAVLLSGILSAIAPIFVTIAIFMPLIQGTAKEAFGYPNYFFLAYTFMLCLLLFGVVLAQLAGLVVISIVRIWRSTYPTFVQENTVEVFCFLRSMTLKSIVALVLSLLFSFGTCYVVSAAQSSELNQFLVALLAGFTIATALFAIAEILVALKAIQHAKRGELYRYPYSMRSSANDY
ncbi:DUF4870 domain-containing protein [Cyanobacteria bacterium FACHB-63]|nr:DUF4870 domain-containing protein [Cyanobacteria bacterium FACHB-63]